MRKTNHYTDNRSRQKPYKQKEKRELSPESYRFKRVLGDLLGYLRSLPHASTFAKCQKQFEVQITELLEKGFTWGYEYPVPIHHSDFKALKKKEWAAIRAIVRKQEYRGSNPNY
jgi:hypothetical protein